LTYGAECIALLRQRHGAMITGLKDSSGDLAYAEDLVKAFPRFDVFPSNEAVLGSLKAKGFAGCISASVNASAALSRAVHDDPHGSIHSGVFARMQGVRALLSSFPLVPAVKAAVGIQAGDPDWARTMPPLGPLNVEQVSSLAGKLADLLDG
jgi:4-hydroxy-tetrahydrodipicolinate synthase